MTIRITCYRVLKRTKLESSLLTNTSFTSSNFPDVPIITNHSRSPSTVNLNRLFFGGQYLPKYLKFATVNPLQLGFLKQSFQHTSINMAESFSLSKSYISKAPKSLINKTKNNIIFTTVTFISHLTAYESFFYDIPYTGWKLLTHHQS